MSKEVPGIIAERERPEYLKDWEDFELVGLFNSERMMRASYRLMYEPTRKFHTELFKALIVELESRGIPAQEASDDDKPIMEVHKWTVIRGDKDDWSLE
jgi:hypothetical protein